MGITNERHNGFTFVQQSTLEKLKCSSCQNYLSITPIYKNSKGDAICGRCPRSETLNFTRDELYEIAIEFQKFPCVNRDIGCLEVLFPKQLAEHEPTCTYRNLDCPTRIYNNCTWQGPLCEILNHFNSRHPASILREHRFEVDFINSHKEDYIMPYEEDIYLVTREGNSTEKIFAIVVKYLGSNSNIEQCLYEISLQSGNNAHMFKTQQEIGQRLEIQEQTIRERLFDPPIIIANINIIEIQNNISGSTQDTASLSDTDDELDYEQLKEVECPVCLELLVSPIYQCATGHSICATCKEKQNVCPSCKAEFKNTKNFALERIIMNMTYPCKHHGCKHKTKAKFIKQHEASCVFGPYKCPLKDFITCSVEFPVTQLLSHIKNTHFENLLELDTVSIPFDGAIEEDIFDVYISRQHNLLFKICFKYCFNEMKFFWAVQLVGPPEECIKYKYELEIIDNYGKGMRLYLKNSCTPLYDKDETFGKLENHVYLHNDQIAKFIKKQLTYRILITKV